MGSSSLRSRFFAAAGVCLTVAAFTLPGVPARAASKPPGAAASGPASSAPSTAKPRTLPSGAVQNCPPPSSRLQAQCLSVRLPHVRQAVRGRRATAVTAVTGAPLTAADLRSAYGLTSVSPTAGTGQTVAIVDAYGDSGIDGDLTAYRNANGLAACDEANGCLHVYNQTGGTSLPATPPATSSQAGWEVETALDVDMISAVCPNCHIDLYEANSEGAGDLLTAVNTAAGKDKFVSNSWSLGAGADFPGESAYDSYLNHPGVAITFASGDYGYGSNGWEAQYPASSQFVTSVGGTQVSGAPGAWSESVWHDASGATGSGCSAGEGKPGWQTDSGCANRTSNDVAGIAEGPAGIDVYAHGAEAQVAGTSAAAPAIAAMYALAGTPAASTYPARYLYENASGLTRVTSGANGTCESGRAYLCDAASTLSNGYNGPTGFGVPTTGNLAPFTAPSGDAVSIANPGTVDLQAGRGLSLQLKAVASSGATPTYSASGLPAGLTMSSSGLITGTATSAGTSPVTVTATDGTASSVVTFTVVAVGSMTASYRGGTGVVKSGVGKCIDDNAASTANGAKIQIWTCYPTNKGEIFTYVPDTYPGDPANAGMYAGTVRVMGKCLNITNGGKANGTTVQLWGCTGAANQEWEITGVLGQLYNPASNKCLDDPGASTTNGKQLDIWTCNGGKNQNWALPASPVDSAIPTLCMADNGGSSANGTAILSWTCTGTAPEKWTAASNGTLRIYGKCLDVVGGNTKNGAAIDLWSCTGGLNQAWQIGAYGQIENVNAEKCLSIPNNTPTKGTRLTLTDCQGDAGQLWAVS